MASVSPAFFAREGRSLIALLAAPQSVALPVQCSPANNLVGRDSVEPQSPSQLKVFLPGYPRLSFSSPYNSYDVAWARARKIERISFAEPALAS